MTGGGNTGSWRAVLFCATGVALFSGMDALMKGAALATGTYSALLWRSILAIVPVTAAYLIGRRSWPEPAVLRLHLLRGLLIAPMAWLFFWSLTRLPIAEAIALSFIAPVIALWLAAVLLRENVPPGSILAAILGLAGVGVILSGRLRGDYEADALWGAAAVLVSAVLFAFNLVLQRRQAQVAGPVEIVFFQNAIMLIVLLPLAPWLAHGADPVRIPAIGGAAALAVTSQLLLSRAYARAPASRLIPIEYSAFAWAALFGWLFFGEPLTLPVAVGVAFILAACLVAARTRPRLAAHVEAEAA